MISRIGLCSGIIFFIMKVNVEVVIVSNYKV